MTTFFDNLRAQGLAPDAMLRALFDHQQQLELACCVQDMLKLRDKWLQPGGTSSGASVVDSSELESLSDIVDSLGYLYDTFEEGDNRLHVWDPTKCEAVSEGEDDEYADDEQEELKEVVAAGTSQSQLGLPPGFLEVLV